MKELELSYTFDKPYVYSGKKTDTYVNLMLEVKPGEDLRKEENTVKGTDFCIVLDVSGSMSERIEGGKSKLETAIESTKNLYQFLTPKDSISLIIYHSHPIVLLDHAQNISKEDFYRKVDVAYTESGSTNISRALREARELLKVNTGNNKKIIFLTDGLPVDDTEEDGIREGELIAEENISITALGIGLDFNYSFIEKLVKPSRGTTDWVNSASQSIKVFESVLKRAKAVVVKDVELELNVSNEVRMNEFYRAVPETTYYGKMKLDSKRVYRIKLDDIENNRFYRYIFEVAVPSPKKGYEGKFRVLTAKLRYKIAASGEEKEQKIDAILEMTLDEEKESYEYLTVKETAKRCEIKKYDDLLNEYLGKGDEKGVIKALDKIIEIAEEIGEEEIIEGYKNMKEEYINKNNIPRNLLIAASNSSTKINDEGYIEDEDDLEEIMNKIF